ncbi:MAG: type IV pilus assembly protein PilM [Planctomycetota bacterium]|jgi:type IV pilus assembly protein PilM
MLKRKIKSLIGLDIGSRTIKAVELTREGHGFVMTGYGQTEVLSEDQRPDAILEVLRDNAFHTKRVVTAVYGKSVIVRYLSMMRMPEEDLRNAIRYEADKYIPFDVEDVVMDSQPFADEGMVEGAENEMRVLLVAVKRALIEDHVSLLNGLGLQPTVIDVDSFAVGNAFELARGGAFYEEDAGRAIALLDIGANKTNINIFLGGTSYFTREIYLAGDDFTHAIAKRLSVDNDSAELRKRDPGDHPEEVMEAVMPTFDDLANEVLLSFDYFENQFDREVEEVFLSGGGARLAGVEEALERTLNRPTQRWDPTEGIEIHEGTVDGDTVRGNAGQLAVAVGLASRVQEM